MRTFPGIALVRVARVLGRQPLTITLSQIERQRIDDLLRHVVLHGEYVGQVAIESLRPKMAARG